MLIYFLLKITSALNHKVTSVGAAPTNEIGVTNFLGSWELIHNGIGQMSVEKVDVSIV